MNRSCAKKQDLQRNPVNHRESLLRRLLWPLPSSSFLSSASGQRLWAMGAIPLSPWALTLCASRYFQICDFWSAPFSTTADRQTSAPVTPPLAGSHAAPVASIVVLLSVCRFLYLSFPPGCHSPRAAPVSCSLFAPQC